jgi:hypothetical protein
MTTDTPDGRTAALDQGRRSWNEEQRAAASDRLDAILDYLADHPDASYADVARDVLNGVTRQRAEQLVRRARQRQEARG